MAGIIKVNQYQDFNGNTLFTSDGSGNLTTQEILYPAFDANLSDNQELTNGVATKLNFDEEKLQEGLKAAQLTADELKNPSEWSQLEDPFPPWSKIQEISDQFQFSLKQQAENARANP